MVDFDLSITWRSVEERLAKTTDPRHRKMLETVAEHGKAEAAGSVDGLMGTLVDDPQYHFWNGGQDYGPKGYDAVMKFYEGFVASGAGFFESYKPRIVVDDENVVTESVMRQLLPGAVAVARGYQVPDPDGHYIVRTRTVIFWPFDEDGRLIGEDSYNTSDQAFEQVPEEELPAEYVAMLAAIGKAPAAR
jgi:hypothetical protein